MYSLALLGMSILGVNMVLLTIVALVMRVWTWRHPVPIAPPPAEADWPTVLVQLPLYNERYVVERLLDAVVAMDYPADKLTIQVLDDSTDDTPAIARSRAAYHRARGHTVLYQHRTDRTGFKAGALGAGLAATTAGEFVAIFDADFIPPRDFLRRLMPEFGADPRLAVVQSRWEHLNLDDSSLTRAEGLALDSYFGVEQYARGHMGLLMNFNGSAGIWRRAAIEDAGGWQGDTLAEDLDLSYRAQLRGWRLVYRPDVTAPAELPNSITAFKRQQFRWSKGSFQVLRKLGPRVLSTDIPLFHKVEGVIHLAAYVAHSLLLVSLLLSLPVVLIDHGQTPMRWSLAWLAGIGPPLLGIVGQISLRKDWPRRLLHYPILILVGIGLAVTNSHATWEAFAGARNDFQRTPKSPRSGAAAHNYVLPLDWTTWAETFLAFYALVTGMLALELARGLAPFIFLYALGFGYTAMLGFLQSDRLEQRRTARQAQTN
jgi:cellulose synthase/poly-beta-1,6-N-acetylglucosamine synthase-like glycosyltransferase